MAEAPKANPQNLLALIRDAYSAKVVVPEFQRSFVWARDNVEEFLSSLLQGYFVGTFLMLDTPTNKPMFPFHLLEGVKDVNSQVRAKDHATVQMVLDGQQRITSLFYAFYEPNISLKGVKNPYRFYLNLDKALNENLDEAVVGVSKQDNKGLANFEKLCQAHKAVPFSLLRETSSFNKWLYTQQSEWQDENLAQIEKLYERLQQFMVPVVALPPETSKGDIVNIFERINRTGVSLSLFDLAVAQLYLKNVKLRDFWDDFTKKNKTVSSIIKPEFLLRVIALLEGKEIRRRSLLDAIDIEGTAFKKRWDEAVNCIVQAHKRISKEYGAFSEQWVPYTSLLVTLAVLLHKLKENSAGAEDYQKVDRWYWSCIISRRYDNAVETKTFHDIRDLDSWMKGGTSPQWLQQFANQYFALDIVNDPRSALYRGLMGLIVRQGAKDFLTGQPATLSECQDDHIFPKSKYKESYGERVDSIWNRTLIWEKTNNQKKNTLPSVFFQECLKKHGADETKLLETLSSHFISPKAYAALKQDNFEEFTTERRKTLEEEVAHLISCTILNKT
ncbi:hypothetical protein NIES4073_07710 [Kalymmatonema gypsitolerans NIES-4073]|nr:hypothetical protein NIES4073_07710 [Scytonema sp. NIES-4073]